MYNIYEKEGEEIAEDAKVHFLFKRIQNPDLKGSIEALKAHLATGDNVTYT